MTRKGEIKLPTKHDKKGGNKVAHQTWQQKGK